MPGREKRIEVPPFFCFSSETDTQKSFSRNLSNSCFQVQEKVKSFCFCQGFLFRRRSKSREIRKKKKREEEENSFA